jgi:hypothetical protein
VHESKGETCSKLTVYKTVGLDLAMETKSHLAHPTPNQRGQWLYFNGCLEGEHPARIFPPSVCRFPTEACS